MSERSLSQEPNEILKDRTGDLHELVEGVLGEQFFSSETFSREDLVDLLLAFYRIYKPFEPTLVEALNRWLPEYDYDRRTDRLEDDLGTLGLDRADLSDIDVLAGTELVDISDVNELYGCLYVVEGSAMGNRVIRKQLEKMLPEPCLDADQFFNEESVSDHWTDFKTRLNRALTSRDNVETAVQSARGTFRMFREGFQ